MLLQRNGKTRGGRPKKDGTPAKPWSKEVSRRAIPVIQRKITKLLIKENSPENKEALEQLGIKRYSPEEIRRHLKK
jgi:hypothetical protein